MDSENGWRGERRAIVLVGMHRDTIHVATPRARAVGSAASTTGEEAAALVTRSPGSKGTTIAMLARHTRVRSARTSQLLLAAVAISTLACRSSIPLSREDEMTTTYAGGREAMVYAPRSARAQKVVFDDPKGRLIHERDTSFRQFFASHSRDFAPGEVEYAKITILEDVLHRLESRSYVQGMVLDLIERHRRVVCTREITGPTGAKVPDDEMRTRRIRQLADAITQVISGLGYPLLDDDDLDQIVARLVSDTGVAWPHAEARDVWFACVTASGEEVEDFKRDLHLTLHGRPFFRLVIRDAVEKRRDLFQGGAAGAPSLAGVKQSFRRFIAEHLDGEMRTAAVANRASAWTAFVDTELDRSQGARLRRPDQSPLLREQFAARVREGVVSKAKKLDKLTVDSLASLLAAELTQDAFRDWLIAKTAPAGAVAPELEPHRAAAAVDAAVVTAHARLYASAIGPLAKARTELATAKQTLQQIVPAGTPANTTLTDDQILASVRGQVAAVTAARSSLALADWLTRTAPNATKTASAPTIAGDLLTAAAPTPQKSDFERAANALADALRELLADGRFVTFQAAVGERNLLLALQAGNVFTKDVRPVKTVLEAAAAYRTTGDALLAVLPAADAPAQAAAKAFRDSAPFDARQSETLTLLHDRTRDTSLVEAARTLAARDVAAGVVNTRQAAADNTLIETRRLATEWFTVAMAAIEKANGALAAERRQIVEDVRKAASAALAAWMVPLEAGGAWPADEKYKTTGALLQDVFRTATRDDVRDSLDGLVARFRNVFRADLGLLSSDDPILTAFARTADLGVVGVENTASIRRVLPAELTKALADKRAALESDATGAALATVVDGVLDSPAVSYLFVKPGSATARDAFVEEFYQAFHHRLGAAVAEEGAAGYDYWWLTFYPKAVPISGEAFRAESLLEINFPQQVAPREDYVRWLQDQPFDREEGSLPMDKVAAVLTSLRIALDVPGLSGRHDGVRRALQEAIRAFNERPPHTVQPTLCDVLLPVVREMPILRKLGDDWQRHGGLHGTLLKETAMDLRSRAAGVYGPYRGLSELEPALPDWYRLDVDHAGADVADLAALCDMLALAADQDASGKGDEYAAGAARALARAPFGYEHLVFAAYAAYRDKAVLPTLADVVTCAFFDGVDRHLQSNPRFSEREQLVQFLVLSGLTTKTGKTHDDLHAAVDRIAREGSGFLKSALDVFGLGGPVQQAWSSGETARAPAIIGPSGTVTSELEQALARHAGVLPDGLLVGSNSLLRHPQLWSLEMRAAEADANLRKLIVHAFQARYPGTPTGDEIRHEFSRVSTNLDAYLYVLIREAWVLVESEKLLAPDSGTDDASRRLARFRNLLAPLLTSNDLLPPGLADSLIGEIWERARPNDGSRPNNVLTWREVLRTSATANDHFRRKLVQHLNPGLWEALNGLCEARFRPVDFTKVSSRQYDAFLQVSEPFQQTGVQIVEMLPTSRDDLVSMAINEGGVIAQIAASAEAEATVESAREFSTKRQRNRDRKIVDDPAPTGDPSIDTSFLGTLATESIGTDAAGYSARGHVAGDFYARAKAAHAYARRREYLDAAITASGRGDRLARWVIRPSDLRSELAGTNGQQLVAAAHSGYPNGDQPFHMLVKVPHAALHQDWVGNDYLYFNSSYIATSSVPMTRSFGLFGLLLKGLVYLVNWPWVDAIEEKVFGAKYPFQWDVNSPSAQEKLFHRTNALGGRIQLDDTDKVNYSEVRKLLEAEAGFIRATRTAQSGALDRVLKELETERDKERERARVEETQSPGH